MRRETWRPISRGPFPVFGGASATTTASGVMILGPTRQPLCALRISWDGGSSWLGISIDTPFGASGGVAEVAPDVVLVTYDSYDSPDSASVAAKQCCFGCVNGAPGSCVPRYQLLKLDKVTITIIINHNWSIH